MSNEEFEEVSIGTQYIKAASLHDGQVIQGRYIACRQSKYGPGYEIQQADGTSVTLNGTGGLDKRMDKVQVGRMIRIVYGGKTPLKSGEWAGNDCHQWTVLVAKEQFEEQSTESPKQDGAAAPAVATPAPAAAAPATTAPQQNATAPAAKPPVATSIPGVKPPVVPPTQGQQPQEGDVF